MDPNHSERLAGDYGIGAVRSIEEQAEGVLNRNYLLVTDQGKFFVKDVREKHKEHLPRIAATELFFFEHGIPAVSMLRTKDGEISRTYDQKTYTLYPFIESDRSHNYTLEEHGLMGKLLGRIHSFGSGDLPKLLTERVYSDRELGTYVERMERYRKMLLDKSSRDADDERYILYINLKLKALPKIDLSAALPNDTLIHGDYHAGNLLVHKESREIVGVCDWEMAQIAARAYEVARSIQYSIFAGAYGEEEALTKARIFIEGYRSMLPLKRDELNEGFLIRTRQRVVTAWMEELHYESGDKRPTLFIDNELRFIKDFVEGDMLARLLRTI